MMPSKGKEHAGTSRSSSTSFSSDGGGGAPLHDAFSALRMTELKSPDDNDTSSIPTGGQMFSQPHAVSRRSRAVSDAVFMSPAPKFQTSNSFQVGDQAESSDDVFAMERYSPDPYMTEQDMESESTTMPCTIVRTEDDPDADPNIGSVDAQVHYPGTACVFVANLPEGARDHRLEAAVTDAFSKFGLVFVKIRRDNRNMPFAFAQYTRDEDADVALREGRGTIIEGRPCRTERVRGNRLFIICRRDGRPITIDEAAKEMGRVGPIVKSEYLAEEVLDMLKINNGAVIEFKNFDPDRDVVAVYRRNAIYRVIPYDVKRHDIPSRQDADRRYLEHYDTERRSVFIGRLPTDVAPEDLEREIRAVMSEVGEVKTVTVISKPPKPERDTAVAFAFCEYTKVDMAIRAVNQMNGVLIVDTRVKVEPKASREIGMPENFGAYGPRQDTTPVRPLRSYRSNRSLQPATPPALNRKSSTIRGMLRESLQEAGGSAPFSPFRYGSEYPSPAQMASPYSVEPSFGMGVPMTPQFSPYTHYSTNAPFTPTGGAWTPYSWAAPYLHDPRYAQAAAASAYQHQHSPFPGYSGRQTEGFGELPTPTKTTTSRHESLTEEDRRNE